MFQHSWKFILEMPAEPQEEEGVLSCRCMELLWPWVIGPFTTRSQTMADDVGRKFIFAGEVHSKIRVHRMSRALPARPGFRNYVWKIKSSAKKPTEKCSSYGQNQGGRKMRLRRLSNHGYIYIQITQKTQLMRGRESLQTHELVH